jgi:polysaccharide biosynthesis PFTS motif protein
MKILQFLKRKARAKRRRIIRNWRHLKTRDDLEFLPRLNTKLQDCRFDESQRGLSSVLLGKHFRLDEISIRQLVHQRRGHIRLFTSVLSQMNSQPISYEMPKEWIMIARQNGIGVNGFLCTLRWWIYVLALGGFAFIRLFKIVFMSIFYRNKLEHQPFAQFMKLSRLGVPQHTINDTEDSFTIIDWYDRWHGRDATISQLVHNAYAHPKKALKNYHLIGQTSEWAPLTFWSGLSVFFWVCFGFVLGCVDLMRGKWWTMFILHEAVLLKVIEKADAKYLAKTYMFSHEACSYKPLWTFGAEARGARCLIYFYSTNSTSVKAASGHRYFYSAFLTMNWERYLVWTESHKQLLLKQAGGNPYLEESHIEVVGPISFHDGSKTIKKRQRPSIAVFDVSPFRASIYPILGQAVDYFTPENLNAFLHDISTICHEYDIEVLYKNKRAHKTSTSPSYIQKVDKLLENGWTLITPEMSAHKVIQVADMVISYPFTSTALIAEHLGIPSIYYDSTGTIQPDDCAMLGASLINSPSDLRHYIHAIFAR